MIWTNGRFKIDDDRNALDFNRVCDLLRSSHWARDRTRETIRIAIENALCFGLFEDATQIGFARVLTDYAVYAVVLDMIVDERFRGKGLGRWFMEAITNHPSIKHIRQILWTSTAEKFYKKFGFSNIEGKPAVLVKPSF